MADLFDALAARALRTSPTLAPALSPRFAPSADEVAFDEPPDLITTTVTDPVKPGARGMPEPAGSPAHRAELRVHEEPPPAVRVPGPQLPDPAVRRPPPDGLPQRRRAVHGDRTEPLVPVAPPPARRPENAIEPAHEPAPAAHVEVHGEPGRKPPPDRPRSGTEPMQDRPEVIPPAALPAARPDAVPVVPVPRNETPHHETPTPVQVTVSIGSVEVRALARSPAQPPPTPPRRPQPRLSLQDYLRREAGR